MIQKLEDICLFGRITRTGWRWRCHLGRSGSWNSRNTANGGKMQLEQGCPVLELTRLLEVRKQVPDQYRTGRFRRLKVGSRCVSCILPPPPTGMQFSCSMNFSSTDKHQFPPHCSFFLSTKLLYLQSYKIASKRPPAVSALDLLFQNISVCGSVYTSFQNSRLS